MKQWVLLCEKIIQISPHRRLLERQYRLPNGHVETFHFNNSGKIVCALVLTKTKQVVLARQFRPGPGYVYLELPGGGVEKGEPPRKAAAREVLEETGYRGSVQFIVRTNDDAWSVKWRYHYVITDAVRVAGPEHSLTEQTEVVLLSLAKFRTHLRFGKLTDVETGYLALDYLGLL